MYYYIPIFVYYYLKFMIVLIKFYLLLLKYVHMFVCVSYRYRYLIYYVILHSKYVRVHTGR